MHKMKLWPDLDNNPQPPSNVARYPGRLTERTMVFLLREWLLQDYTTSYCRALAATRIFRRCYWIDMLGIAAKIQAEHQIQAKDMAIPKACDLIQANWLEMTPTLLKEIDQSPAIFLLNPLGPRMLSQDGLAPLYQRTTPTELCFFISHKRIEIQLTTASRSPIHARMLVELLHTDRWKTLPTQKEKKKQAIERFLDLFIAALQRHFQLPVQRMALPIQVRPAIVETAPYTLIFATRRQDSFICMNNAVCMYQRRLHQQSFRGILSEEWFVAQQEEHIKRALQSQYQQTLQQGRTQRIRRWPDLRYQLLLNNFGQLTLDDYDTIIKQLLEKKEVRCEWKLPASTSEESSIPGNDDTLIWR